MPEDLNFKDLIIGDRLRFEPVEIYFPRRPTVDILILVDTSVTFTTGFGIGMVVDLIRANVDSYVRFNVDLGRIGAAGSPLIIDNTPASKDFKYDNFRFSSQDNGQPILNKYDQVWCFGFAPDNSGSTDDSRITNHFAAPDAADLAVLTEWMNNGGGVFATGDHHYLGATMCSQIPRVRHMRRWTNAQLVPTIGGTKRHDTNWIQNASQDPEVTDPNPPAVIPTTAQSDGIPQPMEWKRYAINSGSLIRRRYRPHPVLCGGELGVIDVFPDHPHEGWIYEDNEVDLNATYPYLGASIQDFPTVGGQRPTPEVISWANTLGDGPYRHGKGEVPAKRFGMLGVYDGDDIDHGRIIVDSTWHHWMDMNLVGLAAAADSEPYDKIVRFFRNVAVWLSREGQRRQMLWYSSWLKILSVHFYEDFNANENVFILGEIGRDVIGRGASDCFEDDWLINLVPFDIREKFIERPPIEGFPIWSVPSVDLAKQAMYGGAIRELIGLRDEVLEMRDEKQVRELNLPKRIQAAFEKGAQVGLDAFDKALTLNAEQLKPFEPPCRFELKLKKIREVMDEK